MKLSLRKCSREKNRKYNVIVIHISITQDNVWQHECVSKLCITKES